MNELPSCRRGGRKNLRCALLVAAASVLAFAAGAQGARVERSLGEGVRGWISMVRPLPTARDAVVDRLDFVRFGVPVAKGTRPEDVRFDFHLLRGDKTKLRADWKVADGFLIVDVTDVAKDGTDYLLDAAKSKVSFACGKAGEAADDAMPDASGYRWADDDWAGRPRHLAVVNPPVPYEKGTVVSLRGEWDFAFREGYVAEYWFSRFERWPGERRISVPGCWEAQGVGKASDTRVAYDYPKKAAATIRNVANGTGWYRRRVRIPAEWAGRRIWLKTGGVRGRGCFWVNDSPVARLDDYAGTWKFDITDLVRPGEEAKVVVEASNHFPNRNAQLDTIARWGGIWRDIELEATPKDAWIDDVYVRGLFDERRAEVRVSVACGDEEKLRIENGELRIGERSFGLQVTVDGVVERMPIAVKDEKPLKSSILNSRFSIPLKDFRPWSPEHPNLYTARVDLVSADGSVLQTWRERFGVRSLEVRGNRLFMNGRQFYVRGFGDDSMYPITGLTPPDRDFHRGHFAAARKAGFNFVRLHTHTEIDEYFQAADEAGILVQPELSYLHDQGCGLFGYDPCRDALEMHLQLRRHPSFAVYCGGNESWLGGNADRKLYRFIKSLDKDRLVLNQDGGRDNTYGTSDLKSGPLAIWERGAYEPGMPFVAHEYLNLTVKADPRTEKDYSGVLSPPATMSDRAKWLEARGLGKEWVGLLQDAQHSLQAHWQKYGIEQARLDPFCDGYCLWLLADYIGHPQDGVTCSANGFLDSMWRPKKGGRSLEDFARFNSPVGVFAFTGRECDAPPKALSWNRCLFDWPDDECYRYADRERFVYEAGERIPVSFHLDNYGEGDILGAELVWSFGGATGRRRLGDLAFGGIRSLFKTEIEAPSCASASRMALEFSVEGTVGGRPFRAGNALDFWVFPRRGTRRFGGMAAAEKLRGALSGRYEGLGGLNDAGVKVAIVEAGSPEEMDSLRRRMHVISISGQTGKPNCTLGWWFAKDQVGVAFKPHPFLKRLPYEPTLTPMLFRIVRAPAKLPIEGLEPGEVVAAGEGGSYAGLYLADGRTAAGFRHVHLSGLDVLSSTPEGTSLLDGILEELLK